MTAKRYWVTKHRLKTTNDQDFWEVLISDEKPLNNSGWVLVEEVPEPKKKKLYAYLVEVSNDHLLEIKYSDSDLDFICYGSRRSIKRLPSHDIEVEE